MGGLLSTDNKRGNSGRNDGEAIRGNKKQRLDGVFNFFHWNSDRQRLPLMQLPDECRVYALSFLDGEKLKIMSCLSKQCNKDCWQVCTITPRDKIPPQEKINDGYHYSEVAYYSANFFREFFYTRTDVWALPFLKVNKIEKLSRVRSMNEHIQYRRRARDKFDNVVSLDISSNEPPERDEYGDVRGIRDEVLHLLLDICKNVRVIDSTGVNFGFMEEIRGGNSNSTVEKVTANRTEDYTLLGTEFQHLDSLKELHMDDCTFKKDIQINRENLLSDLNYLCYDACYPDMYIFLHCKCIERLSIRNAKFQSKFESKVPVRSIPQDWLIKFVRRAPPSLKWFRSDLNQTNIDMLQLDYPGIEFVN